MRSLIQDRPEDSCLISPEDLDYDIKLEAEIIQNEDRKYTFLAKIVNARDP